MNGSTSIVPSPKPLPDAGHSHADGAAMENCSTCLVQPPRTRSAMIAWTIAGIAIVLLVATFFFGASAQGAGVLAGAGGLTLLVLLACPLTMGAMMFFMMRKPH